MIRGTNKEETEKLNQSEVYTPQIIPCIDHKSTNSTPPGLNSKAVFRQLLWVVIGNIGLLAAGFGLSIPAVTITPLSDPTNSVYLTAEQSTWYASVNALASPLGGLVMSQILDRLGRKNTMYLANIVSIVAWALMVFSSTTNKDLFYAQLLISRVFIGILLSLAGACVGVYAAEVSHPDIRGRLVLGSTQALTLGTLMMFTMGYIFRDNWRLICTICMGYSAVSGLILIPMPESPNWLMSKGRKEEARANLKYFRGFHRNDRFLPEEFEIEFRNLERSCQREEGFKKPPFKELVKLPEVYKPIIIMAVFFFCQQITGNFVVIVYAVQFSIEAGVTIDPGLCAIFIGLARVIPCMVLAAVLDKVGRRPTAMFSGIGMAICMFTLAANSWFPSFSISWIPVASIVLYIITSTLGLMALPFVMTAEVFPQKVRGIGVAISISCSWLTGFLAIKMYPTMVGHLGRENVFAFYGVMTLLALLFVWFFLPETKGKTLLEIEEEFRHGNRSKCEYVCVELKECGQKL